MLACLDVHYRGPDADAACVTFHAWPDATPAHEFTAKITNVAAYVPGRFFERELPCLLAVLEQLPPQHGPLEALIVDSYVWLDDHQKPGLGAHLYRALHERTPVIGVAKTHFAGAPAIELTRGASQTPLYITSAGLDPNRAAQHIRSMHGPHRLPTLLKRVDTLCREASNGIH